MRDQSDPQEVGSLYTEFRKNGHSISESARMATRLAEPYSKRHEGPVEKYGRPDEIVVLHEAQAPILGRVGVAVEK